MPLSGDQGAPTPEAVRRAEPLGLRVLAAVGSASVAYAILLAAGFIPASAIPAAGAFALIGVTLFALAWGDPEWGPAPAPAAAPTSAPTAVGSRRPRAIPIPHRSTILAQERSRPESPIRAPTPMILARAVPPGDLLWTRLNPDAVGELPVALVGPVAESAFAALPGEAFETTEFGADPWDGAAEVAGPGEGWPRAALQPDPTWTPTEHEAFTLTPPHLRASPPAWKEIRGPHSPTPRSDPPEGSHCVSCQRSLSNPPAWRSCTSCHRPFCGECAFRARRNMGSGRCLDCRTRVEIEEPRFVA